MAPVAARRAGSCHNCTSPAMPITPFCTLLPAYLQQGAALSPLPHPLPHSLSREDPRLAVKTGSSISLEEAMGLLPSLLEEIHDY